MPLGPAPWDSDSVDMEWGLGIMFFSKLPKAILMGQTWSLQSSPSFTILGFYESKKKTKCPNESNIPFNKLLSWTSCRCHQMKAWNTERYQRPYKRNPPPSPPFPLTKTNAHSLTGTASFRRQNNVLGVVSKGWVILSEETSQKFSNLCLVWVSILAVV